MLTCIAGPSGGRGWLEGVSASQRGYCHAYLYCHTIWRKGLVGGCSSFLGRLLSCLLVLPDHLEEGAGLRVFQPLSEATVMLTWIAGPSGGRGWLKAVPASQGGCCLVLPVSLLQGLLGLLLQRGPEARHKRLDQIQELEARGGGQNISQAVKLFQWNSKKIIMFYALLYI